MEPPGMQPPGTAPLASDDAMIDTESRAEPSLVPSPRETRWASPHALAFDLARRSTRRWSPKRLGITRAWKPLHRMRVLLVDDNPVNVSVASLMLERLGYRVDAVTDGRQAIDAASRRHYSAILMDCEMPVLDGYAATAEIRRGQPDVRVPIIAMTANLTEIDRQRCLDAGMDDFVSKPILMDVLRAALDRWAPHNAD